MSEETDKESQTENATEKKLSDSMERGDVPMSREVALVASLACILISMIESVPHTVQPTIDLPVDSFPYRPDPRNT